MVRNRLREEKSTLYQSMRIKSVIALIRHFLSSPVSLPERSLCFADFFSPSLQYLHISDNNNAISEISVISSLLWLPRKGLTRHHNMRWGADSRLFVCGPLSRRTGGVVGNRETWKEGVQKKHVPKSVALPSRVILLDVVQSVELKHSRKLILSVKTFSLFGNGIDLPKAACVSYPFTPSAPL